MIAKCRDSNQWRRSTQSIQPDRQTVCISLQVVSCMLLRCVPKPGFWAGLFEQFFFFLKTAHKFPSPSSIVSALIDNCVGIRQHNIRSMQSITRNDRSVVNTVGLISPDQDLCIAQGHRVDYNLQPSHPYESASQPGLPNQF